MGEQQTIEEATAAAACGLGRCRLCHHEAPLDDLVAVWWRGKVLYEVCVTCLDGKEVALWRSSEGFRIDVRRTTPIVITSSMPHGSRHA